MALSNWARVLSFRICFLRDEESRLPHGGRTWVLQRLVLLVSGVFLRIEFGMVDGRIEGASSDGRQHVTIESNRSDQNISRSRVSCVLHVVGAHSSPLTRQHLVLLSHT